MTFSVAIVHFDMKMHSIEQPVIWVKPVLLLERMILHRRTSSDGVYLISYERDKFSGWTTQLGRLVSPQHAEIGHVVSEKSFKNADGELTSDLWPRSPIDPDLCMTLNFKCSLQTNRERKFIIWSMKHDQDGPSYPYMVNTFKNFLLQNYWADKYVASGSLLLYDDPGFTLTSLKARSNLFP